MLNTLKNKQATKVCTFEAAESKRLTETKLIFNMCITNLKYEGGDKWNVQYDFEVTDFFSD